MHTSGGELYDRKFCQKFGRSFCQWLWHTIPKARTNRRVVAVASNLPLSRKRHPLQPRYHPDRHTTCWMISITIINTPCAAVPKTTTSTTTTTMLHRKQSKSKTRKILFGIRAPFDCCETPTTWKISWHVANRASETFTKRDPSCGDRSNCC